VGPFGAGAAAGAASGAGFGGKAAPVGGGMRVPTKLFTADDGGVVHDWNGSDEWNARQDANHFIQMGEAGNTASSFELEVLEAALSDAISEVEVSKRLALVVSFSPDTTRPLPVQPESSAADVEKRAVRTLHTRTVLQVSTVWAHPHLPQASSILIVPELWEWARCGFGELVRFAREDRKCESSAHEVALPSPSPPS